MISSKLYRLFLIIMLLTGYGTQAQMQAYLNLKRFYAPGSGTYVETYLLVENTSVTYIADSTGKLSCAVEVLHIFKKDNQIITFKKYCLNGTSVGDSLITPLLDQQRFVIEPGTYEYELEIKDLNDEKVEVFRHSESITVGYSSNIVMISDIELVESMSKAAEPIAITRSGYNLIPMVMNFYPAEFEKLVAYCEIYNTRAVWGDDGKFIVKQYIENNESGKLYKELIKQSRENATEVLPVFTIFPITDLPDGGYNLVIEIRDKENELIDIKKTYFQREGVLPPFDITQLQQIDIKEAFVTKSIPADSLNYFLAAIRVIADDSESMVLMKEIKNSDIETRQKFFYAFWYNRNNTEPHAEWEKYRKQIYKTNKLFGTSIKEGFETDRGRIYLKYGAPNTIMDRPNEPSTYPYQIWHYYKLGNFTNKRFVFYQPDLVTNDYELIHSDLRGEIQNYRWQTMLNSRTTPGDGSIDDPINGNYRYWGGNSQEMFNNPR